MPKRPFLSEVEAPPVSRGCCLLWIMLICLFWGGVAAGIYLLTK